MRKIKNKKGKTKKIIKFRGGGRWGDGGGGSVEVDVPAVGGGVVAGFDEAVVVGAEEDEVV